MNEIQIRAIKTQLPLLLEMIEELQQKVTAFNDVIEQEEDLNPLQDIYKELHSNLMNFHTRLDSLNKFYFQRMENDDKI